MLMDELQKNNKNEQYVEYLGQILHSYLNSTLKVLDGTDGSFEWSKEIMQHIVGIRSRLPAFKFKPIKMEPTPGCSVDDHEDIKEVIKSAIIKRELPCLQSDSDVTWSDITTVANEWAEELLKDDDIDMACKILLHVVRFKYISFS